ncbi:MAG: hypothetical protein B0D92_04765 [Spirochaeta sp. LUC14_002_19_P3]|nr:MAG: hypothetical protein B0D92_04765 [Spirochaeta sp. LUC14_002_19_P3]
MNNIVKVYPPAVPALKQVSLDIAEGEIHALIGENGAGKSTLMNILYGLIPFNSGTISFKGENVRFHSPQAAVKAGIGMVHQEFMLIDSFTVWENTVLGAEPRKGLFLDRSAARERVARLASEYKLNLDVDASAASLSVAARQKLEILKLLYRDVQVLILDEPTAVLTPQETSELFRRLRALRESGKTLVFISHKLNEVLALSDRITVMRRGERAAVLENSRISKTELARAMVGRNVMFTVDKKPAEPGREVLKLAGVCEGGPGPGLKLEDMSFSVWAGEIVGLAGIEGSGQLELVQALTGFLSPGRGRIYLSGRDISGEDTIRRREHLSYIPQDRKRMGSAQSRSIVSTAIMTHHRFNKRLSGRFPFLLSPRCCREFTAELAAAFQVLASDTSTSFSSLSGGNQQKVIIGREVMLNNDFFLLDQPTRGLDAGSIEAVWREIIKRRDSGAACLLISSDLDEIFALADRILVIRRGRIAAELDPHTSSVEEAGEYMLGVHEKA